MLSRLEIENAIRNLLVRYNAEYALLFGSYARGEETPDSDVDAFEISEVNTGTLLYNKIISEVIKFPV